MRCRVSRTRVSSASVLQERPVRRVGLLHRPAGVVRGHLSAGLVAEPRGRRGSPGYGGRRAPVRALKAPSRRRRAAPGIMCGSRRSTSCCLVAHDPSSLSRTVSTDAMPGRRRDGAGSLSTAFAVVNVSGSAAMRRRPPPSLGRGLAQVACRNLRPVPAVAELHVDQLARCDVDVDAAVLGESPRHRDHGGKSADTSSVSRRRRGAGRPQVDARRRDHADADRRRSAGRNRASCRSGRRPVQSRRGIVPCGARSQAAAPSAAPPSAACTGRPRPAATPSAAAAAGRRAGPTAFPPPPSCTRRRARPSRAGAPDAPRDGNALHSSAGPSAPIAGAHLGTLPHLLGGVRRRLGVCTRVPHVHGAGSVAPPPAHAAPGWARADSVEP